MEKITILLADDHPSFREGLSRLLDEEDDLTVVAQAGDGEEAVRLAKQMLPDIAIVDVSMPKLDGIQATSQIKAACAATAVLIMSAFGNESYVVGAVEAGASGYLSKSVQVRELVAAIRSLHAGETVLDPQAARKVFSRLTHGSGALNPEDARAELHPRELEVLRLAAKGKSNKEIAEDLAISVRTVQSHLTNIFNKLDISSRTEAVLHALRAGWFSLEDLS